MNDRGATTVEFALVVPLFLALTAMVGYFAWTAYVQSQLEQAAQRAARYAAVPTTEGGYAYDRCAVLADANRRLTVVRLTDSALDVRDGSGPLTAACTNTTAPVSYVRVRLTHELDNPFADLLTILLARPGKMTVTGSGQADVEAAP